MTSKIKKVVIDTNVFISAIIAPASIPAQTVALWQKGSFDIIISSLIVGELQEVFNRKHIRNRYVLHESLINDLISTLRQKIIVSERVHTLTSVSCRDPKDAHILALALSAKADFLITGDDDLLVLRSAPAIDPLKICTAKEFLVEISSG